MLFALLRNERCLTFGVAMKSKALNCRISKGGTNKRDWIPDNHQQSKTVENPIKAQTNCAEGNNQSTEPLKCFNRVLSHQHQSPKCSCHIDSAATAAVSARKMRGPRLTERTVAYLKFSFFHDQKNRPLVQSKSPTSQTEGHQMLLLRQPDPHHNKADGDHAATDPEQYPVFVGRARSAHRFHHIARRLDCMGL